MAKSFICRVGLSLGHFEAPWECLPVYPSTMPNNFENADLNHVYNPTLSPDIAGPSMSGPGSQAGALPAFDLSRLRGGSLSRADNNLSRLAAARLSESRPGDWDTAPPSATSRPIQHSAKDGTVLQGGESKDSLERIISCCLRLTNYVDNVDEFFELTKGGESVLDWDHVWHYAAYDSDIASKETLLSFSRVMGENWLSLREGSGQGARFGRAYLYLTNYICSKTPGACRRVESPEST